MRWKKIYLFHKNNTSFSYYDDNNLVFTLISIFVDMIDIELWSFTFEFVSVRLLFNANSAFLQLYHDENKLNFNEMMMKSLCTRPTRLVGSL
jgi:hypothetical protein